MHSDKMAHYVVAGKPDCPNFLHAVHLCKYLDEQLPNFSYKLMELDSDTWKCWLNNKNQERGWHQTTSPVIWKQFARYGGKANLIGSTGEFLEYVFDYYGHDSAFPRAELQNMVEDARQFLAAKDETERNKTCVCVSGFGEVMFGVFFPQLVEVLSSSTKNEVTIKLFDDDLGDERLQDVVDLLEDVGDFSARADLVQTYEEALTGCDLLVIVDDFGRKTDDEEADWHMRTAWSFQLWADQINAYAKRSLKILLAGHGAACFGATILMESCTTVRLGNVVAVTGDVGHCPLNVVARKCEVPLREIGAPPVWGSVGISSYVDVEGMFKVCAVRRPNERALRAKKGSTLPLGTVHYEIRSIGYLLDGVDVWGEVNSIRDSVQKRLGRPASYSKVSAAVTVLKVWLHGKPSDSVMSLGICSNGSFGLPPRVCMSQPAIFDGRFWVPFEKFPMCARVETEIARIVPEVLRVLQEYGVASSEEVERQFRAQSLTTETSSTEIY